MILNLDYVIDFISHGYLGGGLGIGPGVLWVRNADIHGNKTELTEQDVNFLATSIQSNPVVYKLHLEGCVLSDLKGTLTTLMATCNIRSIEFTGMDLNASVLSEIGEGVKQNASLKDVAFSNVKFGSDNDVDVLSKGLRDNSSVSTARFSQTNLTQTAIRSLIQIAIMQRDAIWSQFHIFDNKPRLNIENRALLALVTNTGYGPHKNRPIIIDWHYRALIKMLNEAKTYYESLFYLDRIKLLHQLYDASLKRPAQTEPADEAEITPITHKSFKHAFLSMFRAKLSGQVEPSNHIRAFLPGDITRKIMSFMPRHQTLPAPEDILVRIKSGYSPRYEF